jgi:hypothetical protein
MRCGEPNRGEEKRGGTEQTRMKCWSCSGDSDWEWSFLTATGAPRHIARYTVPNWPLRAATATNASHHITSHHITSHHITSHHNTSHVTEG